MALQDFVAQLRELGYEVKEQADKQLAFPYVIPVGRLVQQRIQLGFIGPDDFPATPPSGPHVSPQLLPLNNSVNTHPQGGIHASPFGAAWEYWSRPFPNWAGTERTARIYMAHIRHLFETL